MMNTHTHTHTQNTRPVFFQAAYTGRQVSIGAHHLVDLVRHTHTQTQTQTHTHIVLAAWLFAASRVITANVS